MKSIRLDQAGPTVNLSLSAAAFWQGFHFVIPGRALGAKLTKSILSRSERTRNLEIPGPREERVPE
jgi:hypothetical protein